MEPAAEDQAGADAAGELDVEQVGRAAAGAVLVLGHGAAVRVVVDDHRETPSRRPSSSAGASSCQPGRIAWSTRADRRSIGRGHAEPDREQVRGGDAGVGGRPPDEVGGDVEGRGAVRVGVGERLDLGQDLRAAVGDGDPDVTVPDVDAGDPAGTQGERHQERGPPAPALVRRTAVLGLHHETRLEQLADQARDRGARQAGAAGEVGPALGSAGAEQTGDGAQVGRAQLREGVAGHERQPRPIHPEVGLIPGRGRRFPH